MLTRTQMNKIMKLVTKEDLKKNELTAAQCRKFLATLVKIDVKNMKENGITNSLILVIYEAALLDFKKVK